MINHQLGKQFTFPAQILYKIKSRKTKLQIICKRKAENTYFSPLENIGNVNTFFKKSYIKDNINNVEKQVPNWKKIFAIDVTAKQNRKHAKSSLISLRKSQTKMINNSNKRKPKWSVNTCLLFEPHYYSGK